MGSERRSYFTRCYNIATHKTEFVTFGEFQKRQLATFDEIQKYFLSDECDWMNIEKYHPDIKFVNHLKRYCGTLKKNKIANDDKTALELVAESRIALDLKTVSETKRLLLTCWTERDLSYEQAAEIFRLMANGLLQDVFIKPMREINVVNFSELEPPAEDSNRPYRFLIGASSSYVSSVGKRKCSVCGRPAINNICSEHIK